MRVVIIGAGVTGLAVAWKLSRDHEVVLLEKRASVGGIATSFKHQNFTLDSGPHKIYSLIPGILDEMKALLGDEATIIPKTSGVIIDGKRLGFPIKFTGLFLKFSPLTSFKLGFGFGIAVLKSFFVRSEPKSYAEYFRRNFGTPAYELVFKQLAEKSWGNPETLTADFARRRVPFDGVFKMLKSMFFKDRKLSAENFYYPRQGFIEMSKIMLDKVLKANGNIIFNSDVQGFETDGNKIIGVKFSHEGHMKKITADFVVSTAAITMLPAMFNAPPEVMTAASGLKFRSLIIVYILVNKPQVMTDVWTFVPDRNFIFQRLAEQKNFSQQLGPKDQTVVMAEVMCDYNDAMWNAPNDGLYNRVLVDLIKTGLIREGEGSGFFVLKLKNIYPVYELGYQEKLNKILEFTGQYENFITLGRLGLFNYNNTDHCVDMAIWCANHIRSRKTAKDWLATRKRFDSYVIVD